MRPWHLTLSSTPRHPLFPSEARRHEAVLTVVRVCHAELVLFCVVDEHVHAVVLCDRGRCGYLARGLQLALAPLVAVPTQPTHTGVIHGRNHMEEVHRYVLQQPAHHGLPGHPALWGGSCFLDLVGARRIPGLHLRLDDVLPRVPLATSCCYLGVPVEALRRASDEDLRDLGAKGLVAMAASACAAPPDLRGRLPHIGRARRAAGVLAHQVGISPRDMTWAMDIHPGSARKLAAGEAEPADIEAIRRRVGLEQALRGLPLGPLPENSRGASHRRG